MHNISVIVPLAGPDFLQETGQVKALHTTARSDLPLLLYCLRSRPWSPYLSSACYSFILQDHPQTRNFYNESLRIWFPDCKAAFINSHTHGASMSLLPGLSHLNPFENPPCIIDLADISFTLSPAKLEYYFSECCSKGFAFTFSSKSPLYSYFSINDNQSILRSREKSVISTHASAGVYSFPSLSILLQALSYQVNNAVELSYNNLCYVSTLFNALVTDPLAPEVISVSDVHDIKR